MERVKHVIIWSSFIINLNILACFLIFLLFVEYLYSLSLFCYWYAWLVDFKELFTY